MAPTIKTIGEYKTHQDYFVDFFGDNLLVTQTETPSVIRRWIRDVVYRHRRSRSSHPLVVGVGVQWTPRWYFSAPKGYYRPADTLQLWVGTLCLIIQLSYCERVPHILRRNYFTLTDWHGRSFRPRSFEEIVETCMGFRGVRLDKNISKSNWSVGYLSQDQLL
ncbi:hypothetical protein DY000_02043337 [Brassica cretica]|uniref:3'-5' exonuclease domain-containing protein n=1 Tax=Brassica cretica TaxID=69181 RepID=A0ABQ7BLK7_BRACR|nr:hypothetical protein DY000_02043337 [Brassica cretica]